MQIAGIVVHARPEKADVVEELLRCMPGVEVHARQENGRLVVTVEEEGGGYISETLIKLQDVDGVLSASMVYQQSEEEEVQRA